MQSVRYRALDGTVHQYIKVSITQTEYYVDGEKIQVVLWTAKRHADLYWNELLHSAREKGADIIEVNRDGKTQEVIP